jgi:hypothetical protein
VETFQPFVMVVYGNRKSLLGVILTDNILIQDFLDLCRRRNL